MRPTFELDSEEATHSHQLSPVVTLSVVCTLKGTYQQTLLDPGVVQIHEYKRSKQCRRCWRYSTDFKALNAIYVGDVGDGVCSFYANVYRHTVYCIHAPHPSKRECSFLGALSLHLNHLYSIAIGKLRLAIWDTSFWTFWLKFGHNGPWDIS